MSDKSPQHVEVTLSECSFCNKIIANGNYHSILCLNGSEFKWIVLCNQCYKKNRNVKAVNDPYRMVRRFLKYGIISKKNKIKCKIDIGQIVKNNQEDKYFYVKCDCCGVQYKIKDYKKIAKFIKEFPASYLIKNYKTFLDCSVVEEFSQQVESIIKFYNKKLCASCYRQHMIKQIIVESQIRNSNGFRHEKPVVQNLYIGNLYRTQKYDGVLSSIDDE